MQVEKALVIRPGHALGDALFVSPVPRLVAEMGYEVIMACDDIARPIYKNNPYISSHIKIPHIRDHKNVDKWIKNLPKLAKKYDRLFHAHGYVEVGLMYRTDLAWGTIPNTNIRRKKAEGVSYQDMILEKLGFEQRGLTAEIYFTEKEEEEMARYREKLDKEGKKLVLWQMDGSTQSKTLFHGPDYLIATLKEFPDTAHFIFSGEDSLKARIPDDPRLVDGLAEKVSVRESIKLCKIADLVIGPESFLVNAAGAFDTPKIIFFSHSAPENLCKYYKNCYPIVPLPEVTCHPCYLIQIDFKTVYDPVRRGVCREFERNCKVWNPTYIYESLGPQCCYHLPHAKVMQTIGKILGG